MDENGKNQDGMKIKILSNEYTTLRSEIRVYSILEIIIVCVSILIFAIMFMMGSTSNQYILLFISPMVSILLLIIGLTMFAYTANLSLLASEIEDDLNDLLGAQIMKWESTVGIFGGRSKDFLVKRLGKAWLMSSFFGIAIACALIVSTLWYGFGPFYNKVGDIAWIFLLFDIAVIAGSILIGYRLLRGAWMKIKHSK